VSSQARECRWGAHADVGLKWRQWMKRGGFLGRSSLSTTPNSDDVHKSEASTLCVEPNPERAVVEVASLPRLGLGLFKAVGNVAESTDEMRNGWQPRLLVVHNLLGNTPTTTRQGDIL
jgi:hypothetical protein